MFSLGPVLLLALASAQSAKQTEYLQLAHATVKRPISHAELTSAVLSPEGVATIRAVFEASIAESLALGGALVTPELGGESMLHDDGRLQLVVYPDPIHPLIRETVARKGQPEDLLAFLDGSTEGKFLLKNTGGLHALLYQLATAPDDGKRALLDDVLGGMVAQHFRTWSTDPIIQARMIEKTDWRGRYVGFWHIHPPRLASGALAEGIEPSMEDMQNAIELGQFLTIVFQPEGFDLYDLSPLAATRRADLSRVRVTRHRGPEWNDYFEARLRIAQGSSVP